LREKGETCVLAVAQVFYIYNLALVLLRNF
jgi:hypothetical protein